MSSHASEVIKNIEFLKSVDEEKFYEMEEEEVRKYIGESYNELVKLGSRATEELGKLLEDKSTWSCYFALKIMREVKDPESIPYLINFLRNDSDYWEVSEEAMFALAEIGKPSIPLLMKEVKKEFEDKIYNFYMVGALTRIAEPEVYDFMIETTKDFLQNPEKYAGWFHIDHFTFNFEEQGRKDALPLLKQLLKSKTVTDMEQREILDTVRMLEDPEGYKRELMEMAGGVDKTSAVYEEKIEAAEETSPELKIDREEIEKTDIGELVNDDNARVIIRDENADKYLPLLYTIESTIARHYKGNPSLKDKDVIFALKNIRNVFKKEFKPANALEFEIVLNLKISLYLNDFSKNEVIACIKRILNSVKRHHAVDGKRGYLDFIIDFV